MFAAAAAWFLVMFDEKIWFVKDVVHVQVNSKDEKTSMELVKGE